MCILFELTKIFHILFNTISPCPSQTGAGDDGKEKEWNEGVIRVIVAGRPSTK